MMSQFTRNLYVKDQKALIKILEHKGKTRNWELCMNKYMLHVYG